MQVKPLVVGPIVGEATNQYLRVLGRSETYPSVGVMRLAEKSDFSDAEIRFVEMDLDFDLTGIAIFCNLKPETTYYYQYGWIETDITKTPCPLNWYNLKTYSLKTLSVNSNKSCSFILGSCRYLLRKRLLKTETNESEQFYFKEKGDQTFKAIIEGHVQQNQVSQIIMCGDQIYADDLNIFFASGDLDDFQIRYHVAFSQPYIRELMSSIPTFMILDDHEIEDNWPAHASSKDRHGKYLYAMHAYQTYQVNHSPLLPVENNQIKETPNKYWYTYRDGCADFFVMDVRTERNIKVKRIISLEQMKAFKNWLKSSSNSVKCVVSSVPLFPNLKDANDQWGQFVKQRNEVIDFIALNQIKKVVFLSGDIHNSYTSILEGNQSKIIQIISSPFYWPLPIGTGYPEDYTLCGAMPDHASYTITTPSKFIRDHNFTRIDINPNGLEISVYNQEGKLLDKNKFSFELTPYKLILHSLKCHKNEDWVGLDECRLDIYVDDHHPQYLNQQMDEGDTWSINQSFCFNEKIDIKLFDEDSLNLNDFLGELTITVTDDELPRNSVSHRFTKEGANYSLNYTITNN